MSKSISGDSYHLYYKDLGITPFCLLFVTLSIIQNTSLCQWFKILMPVFFPSPNMSFLLRDHLAFIKFMVAYPQIQLFDRHRHLGISSWAWMLPQLELKRNSCELVVKLKFNLKGFSFIWDYQNYCSWWISLSGTCMVN